MEVDQEGSSQTTPGENYTLPNFGTKKFSLDYAPSIASPTTIPELFEEYKKFSLLQKKDSMMSNIEAGTTTYVVSMKWLKKYLDFILYD